MIENVQKSIKENQLFIGWAKEMSNSKKMKKDSDTGKI